MIMDAKEILHYLKENGLDFCPECGNQKGNEITPEPEGDKFIASLVCANPECGLSWGEPKPDE